VKGAALQHLKLAISYLSPQPIRISGRHKDKQSLTQYITTEEVNDDTGENAMTNLKMLVFDRLQLSMSGQRLANLFVFSRMGKDKIPKPSVFHGLKKHE